MIENPFAPLSDIPKEYEDILFSGLKISQITLGRWKHSLGLFRKEILKTTNPSVLLVGQYISKIPLKEVKRSLLKLAVDSETLIVFFERQFMIRHLYNINELDAPFIMNRFACFKNLYKYLFHVVFCVRNNNWVNNFRRMALKMKLAQEDNIVRTPFFLFKKDIVQYKLSFGFSSFRQSLLFDALALHSRKQSFNFFFVPRFHRSYRKAFSRKRFSKFKGIDTILNNSFIYFKTIKSLFRKFTFTPTIKAEPVDQTPVLVTKPLDDLTTFIFFPKLKLIFRQEYYAQSFFDANTMKKMAYSETFDIVGNYNFSGFTKMHLESSDSFDPEPYKIKEQTFRSMTEAGNLKIFDDRLYNDKVNRFSIPKYLKKFKSKFKNTNTYYLIYHTISSSHVRFLQEPHLYKVRYEQIDSMQSIVNNDFSLISQCDYIKLNYKKKIKLMLIKLIKSKSKYFSLDDKYIDDNMIADFMLFLEIKPLGL